VVDDRLVGVVARIAATRRSPWGRAGGINSKVGLRPSLMLNHPKEVGSEGQVDEIVVV